MTFSKRLISAVAVVALLLAACGGGAGEATTTTTSGPTTTTLPAPEAMQIAYRLEAGKSYTFELEMNQTMEMTTTGDAAALAEEDLPGEMKMIVSGPTQVTYAIADGPEDGTYEITITSDLSGLDFDITIDGETAEAGEIPDFAEVEPQATTIVVDEHGKPIGADSEIPDDLFGGLFGDMGGMMGDMGGSMFNPAQFFGPALTDDEVEVGDTWTETTEIPLMGEDAATSTVTSTIDRMEDLDGTPTMVIETVVANSEINFDLAELLLAMFEGFVDPEQASEEDLAMLEQFRDQMKFLFVVDPSETNMTSWFDPEAGMTLQSRLVGDTHMMMDVNVPDDETGEMMAFTLDMSISQDMTYRLVDSAGA